MFYREKRDGESFLTVKEEEESEKKNEALEKGRTLQRQSVYHFPPQFREKQEHIARLLLSPRSSPPRGPALLRATQ